MSRHRSPGVTPLDSPPDRATPFLRNGVSSLLPRATLDGCRECGFAWDLDVGTARATVLGAPGTLASLLRDREATARPAPDTWSPSAYVWHLADMLRFWAERLHAIARDPAVGLVAWDPDQVARVRGYDDLPQATGLWALERAGDDLALVLETVTPATAFTHPEWGRGDVGDVLRWLAHEVVHHEGDVRRGLNPA